MLHPIVFHCLQRVCYAIYISCFDRNSSSFTLLNSCMSCLQRLNPVVIKCQWVFEILRQLFLCLDLQTSPNNMRTYWFYLIPKKYPDGRWRCEKWSSPSAWCIETYFAVVDLLLENKARLEQITRECARMHWKTNSGNTSFDALFGLFWQLKAQKILIRKPPGSVNTCQTGRRFAWGPSKWVA